jgi:hypothetical protein
MFRDGTFDQHNTLILLRFVLILFMRARYWSIKTRARVLLEDTSSTRREKKKRHAKRKRGAQKSVFFFFELVRVRERRKKRDFFMQCMECETLRDMDVRKRSRMCAW